MIRLGIDSWTVAERHLRQWFGQPGVALTTLLFPVLVVLMFGYLIGGDIVVEQGVDYLDYLLPGAFALTMLFGLEATTLAVVGDVSGGIVDRLRAMPVSTWAVLGGRVISDLVVATFSLIVMLGCGFAVGWRWHDGTANFLAVVGLLMLFRLACIWIGVYLGLLLRTPANAVAIQILIWPVGFLSSAYVATSGMPGWLGAIAEWNPLSSVATASRQLLGNPVGGSHSWVVQHAPAMAVVWSAMLIVVFAPLAVRRFGRVE